MLWIPAEHLTDDEVAAALRTVRFRGHDTKSLMRSLLAQGIEPVGLELDTAIAAYLLRPAEARYELGHLLEDYTTYAAPRDDPTASGQLDLGGTQVSAEVRAARDALAVAALVDPITSNLAEQGMVELYEAIENPLVVVLARMEHVGIAVDRAYLEQLYQKLTADVARLGADLRTISGHEDLNVNSTIQLRQILFTERGLTPVKKTKTGASTDASSLEKLREQWPEFIGPLLQYREVEKLRGPTERVCSSRSPPTGASTPRSTRPSPAPAGSARTGRTCTTSRCVVTKAGTSGGCSCRPPAT